MADELITRINELVATLSDKLNEAHNRGDNEGKYLKLNQDRITEGDYISTLDLDLDELKTVLGYKEGHILSMARSVSNRAQIMADNSDDNKWRVRVGYPGEWSDWNYLFHDGNLDTENFVTAKDTEIQEIEGSKIFRVIPVTFIPPTLDAHIVNKEYVDSVSKTLSTSLFFTSNTNPVDNGYLVFTDSPLSQSYEFNDLGVDKKSNEYEFEIFEMGLYEIQLTMRSAYNISIRLGLQINGGIPRLIDSFLVSDVNVFQHTFITRLDANSIIGFQVNDATSFGSVASEMYIKKIK